MRCIDYVSYTTYLCINNKQKERFHFSKKKKLDIENIDLITKIQLHVINPDKIGLYITKL